MYPKYERDIFDKIPNLLGLNTVITFHLKHFELSILQLATNFRT